MRICQKTWGGFALTGNMNTSIILLMTIYKSLNLFCRIILLLNLFFIYPTSSWNCSISAKNTVNCETMTIRKTWQLESLQKYSQVCHVNSDNISPIVFEMTLSATLNVTTLWLGLRVFVGGVIGHMTLQFNSSMQLDRRWLCQRSIKRSK